MGCSCKKKVNTKYMDDEEKLENELRKMNGVEKIGNAVGQFFFGLLISVILIIGLIPLCCYIIFSACTGRDMSIRIPNLFKMVKK